MADKKISALTGASTPLAGTEVLPIVQSGVTVKVAVSNLTAGRAISATQLTSTVAIGTAPLVVTSTTNVANLNASSLNGATFSAPGAIGGGTAAAANFTSIGSTIGSNFATTSGSVGIGTASPAATLDVAGSTASNVQQIFGRGPGADVFTVRYTNGVAGENVVIGTLGLDYGNGVWADMAAIKFLRASISGVLAFYASAAAASGTEKMRVTSTGVGVGTTAPSASAILDAQSTTQGVRMPNMTTAEKNAIAAPAAGLMVFDTSLAKLCVYSGAAWETITSL
jgi:hypothetical protein